MKTPKRSNPEDEPKRPRRSAVEGPPWVMHGCENCGGDLYETEIDREMQYFECLLCGREHERPAGTRKRPKLLPFG